MEPGTDIAIHADGASRTFHVPVREPGLAASLRSVVRRRTREVRAVADVSFRIGRPITIFPGGLRLALTTVFRAGLAVTVPAQALTGRLDWTSAVVALSLATFLTMSARLLWLRALRRYEGASA